MKILYLVHQFYPEYYTGTEKFVLNIAATVQKTGNSVKVITYSFYEDSFYNISKGNILLKEFTYRGVPVTAFRHRRIPEDIHTALVNGDVTEIANEIIVNEKIDIVHVGHPMRVAELINSSKYLGIPYIITLTDFWLICPKYILLTSRGNLCTGPERGNACHDLCPEFPKDLIKRRLNIAEVILFNSKKVISPSNFVGSIFKKEFGNLDMKVINHGISYSKIKKNRRVYKKGDKLIFCYAGSLNRHKGVNILLDAFKNIESKDVVLKIYGSGPDELYVNKLKDTAKEYKRIEFCGVFSEEQVGDILSKVDVVIVPSLWYENYPLILHEALACNVPVIVSNVGGMAEKIIDGLNGYTFRIGDSNHLKSVLELVINNPQMLNELKSNIKNSMIPTVEQEAYAYYRIYKNINNLKIQIV